MRHLRTKRNPFALASKAALQFTALVMILGPITILIGGAILALMATVLFHLLVILTSVMI